MITSRQILKATRLKSPKTLTRWANAGIIPKPHIGTHPSGRGKIAYWPDSVLKRCQRIAELQRAGHTLSSALALIEHDRLLANIKEVTSSESASSKVRKILSEKDVKLSESHTVKLASFVHAFIIKAAENVVCDTAMRERLVAAMRSADVATQCFQFVRAGYNPICLFDGEQVQVVPDFLVSHKLSEIAPSARALVTIQAVPPIRKAFSALGRDLPNPATARPAPKVWAQEDGAVVEYSIFLGGGLGFELIRESAKIIGEAPLGLGDNDGP